MNPLLRWAAVAALGVQLCAEETSNSPARSCPALELHDQFDRPHKLVFPAQRPTLLAIADRSGSDQVDGWIAALRPRFADRIDFRGLADVRSVPSFLQSRVRTRFQEKRKYPVMMDWSGSLCDLLGSRKGHATILVLDRAGEILGRIVGPAEPDRIDEVAVLLEKALAAAPPSAPKPGEARP